MIYRKLFLCLITLGITALTATAQEERWEAYVAKYAKGAGSVTTNFGLLNFTGTAKYPYLVIAGVKFGNCTIEGFPSGDELGALDIMSDSINSVVSARTPAIFAGTFTYQCERLNYFYVEDTFGVRRAIAKMVNKDYRNYVFNVAARPDKEWNTYRKFLYPNEQTQEIIENGKMASILYKAGDKLDKPRKVDHWLYFKTAQGRTDFLPYASMENFKVEDSLSAKTPNTDFPFALHISRTDYVDVNSISKVTIALKKQARKLEGTYDSWECAIIKE